MVIVDISNLNKAAVLAALYNNSKQQGMGIYNPRGRTNLSIHDAEQIINTLKEKDRERVKQQYNQTEEQSKIHMETCPTRLYFDYLFGRILKIDITGNSLETTLYNRDVGENAAEKVISKLRIENSIGEI